MKSILFSLWQHFWTLPLWDALIGVFTGMHGTVRALFIRSKDAKALSAKRMAVCEKCDFFDADWQTCGTPGETMGTREGGRIKVGCWCYLPLATRDPQKDCWGRYHDLHLPNGEKVGWPDDLRPAQSKS